MYDVFIPYKYDDYIDKIIEEKIYDFYNECEIPLSESQQEEAYRELYSMAFEIRVERNRLVEAIEVAENESYKTNPKERKRKIELARTKLHYFDANCIIPELKRKYVIAAKNARDLFNDGPSICDD